MKKRLYFLLPNAQSCEAIVTQLQHCGVKQGHLHVIGNRFISLAGLPQASFLQKSNFCYGIRLGFCMGGAAGLLGGVLAFFFPPVGAQLLLGKSYVLVVTLAGAVFATVTSALMSYHAPNRKLKPFENAISAGKLLLIVDVPAGKVGYILDLVKRHQVYGQTPAIRSQSLANSFSRVSNMKKIA